MLSSNGRQIFLLVWYSFEAPSSKPHCSITLRGSFQDLIWAKIAQNQIDKVVLIFSYVVFPNISAFRPLTRYYQLISILYFLIFFTIFFVNFVKNGSECYFFIIFCQNRDLDLICWSIFCRLVLCHRSRRSDHPAELATRFSQKC